ncbi:MAG: hypothetical protein Q7K45_01510 [Nanoarchaeota archaeon]|nr:hypothetical protein [Nanoarchaeota archaeon]
MAKPTKERELLKGALKDLESELKQLRNSKKQLEAKFKSASGNLGTLREQEIRFRNLISAAMKKETFLLEKKNSLKDKLAEVAKRMEKVKNIERELGDL